MRMGKMKEVKMNDSLLLEHISSHVESIEQLVLLARKQAELVDDQASWNIFEALNDAYLKVLAAGISARKRCVLEGMNE